MDKEDVVYTQWNITLTQQRRKYCHFQQHEWNWKGIILSEISQRKTNNGCFHLYMETKKKKKANKQIKMKIDL